MGRTYRQIDKKFRKRLKNNRQNNKNKRRIQDSEPPTNNKTRQKPDLKEEDYYDETNLD